MMIRVINNGHEVLPGGSADDFNGGKPVVFLGAWFANERPQALGTFQHTLRIEEPIPLGRSADVNLEIKPSRPGNQYLSFGLFRAAISGKGNGPVGEVTSLPVNVARGSWIDNHRPLFLDSLIAAHLVGFAVALLLLYLWNRAR